MDFLKMIFEEYREKAGFKAGDRARLKLEIEAIDPIPAKKTESK